MLYGKYRSLALAALIGWGLGAGLSAQDDVAADKAQAAEAAKVAVDTLNGKFADETFAAMTTKGSQRIAGSSLHRMLALSSAGTPPGQPKGVRSEKIEALVAEHGLDKVPMGNAEEAKTPSNLEEFKQATQRQEEYEAKLVACVKPEKLQDVIKAGMQAMSEVIWSPTFFQVGEVSIAGDSASVLVNEVLDPTVAEQSGESGEPTPAMYLKLVKKDGKWLFDEIDSDKTLELMLQKMAQPPEPFKAIEGLEIEGQTIEGQSVSLAGYKGKVVLIDFWATWCQPCVASLPELKELHAEFHDKGFEILGVAGNDPDALKTFLANMPLPWSSVIDGQSELASKYKIAGFPTTLLIDREGRHVATNLHGATLHKAVKLLLAGQSIESLTGSADDLLEAGRQKARAEKKLVFLRLAVSSDPICQAFESWMDKPEIREKLDKVFVDVSLDIPNNPGAYEYATANFPNAAGTPYFAILDAVADKVLITCEDAEIGQIGLPSTDAGLNHFRKMFETTGRFTPADLELFRKTMSEVVSAYQDSIKK